MEKIKHLKHLSCRYWKFDEFELRISRIRSGICQARDLIIHPSCPFAALALKSPFAPFTHNFKESPALKGRLFDLLKIPQGFQRLVLGTHQIADDALLDAARFYPWILVLLPPSPQIQRVSCSEGHALWYA